MNSPLPRQITAIIKKDFQREMRSREIITTTVSFAVLLMVIFAFGFYTHDENISLIFPGTLWISVVFTSTLAITRTFQHEKDGDCLRALALIPGSEYSLYIGKFLVNLSFILLFELFLFPLLLLAFSVDIGNDLAIHIVTLLVGTIGIAALGTLVSAMLVRNELREVLLPIVLYPLLIPLLIAGVIITSTLMEGGGLEAVQGWLQAMIAMDLAYFVLSAGLFRWVLSAIE